MNNPAIREIQSDAHKLVNIAIPDAIDSCNWVGLYRLAERLQELAQNGLYHASLETAKSLGKTLSQKHREPEPR